VVFLVALVVVLAVLVRLAVQEQQIKDMVVALVRDPHNMALAVAGVLALLVEMELQLTAATAATVLLQTSVAPL
jgi:hypothetical protein